MKNFEVIDNIEDTNDFEEMLNDLIEEFLGGVDDEDSDQEND